MTKDDLSGRSFMKDSNRKPRQRRSKTVEHIGTLYDNFDCQQLSKLSSYWLDKGQRARRISSLWPRPALLSCYSLGALSLALCIGNHPRIRWIEYPLSSFRQMDHEIGISWTVDFLIPSLYARIETSHTQVNQSTTRKCDTGHEGDTQSQ